MMSVLSTSCNIKDNQNNRMNNFIRFFLFIIVILKLTLSDYRYHHPKYQQQQHYYSQYKSSIVSVQQQQYIPLTLLVLPIVSSFTSIVPLFTKQQSRIQSISLKSQQQPHRTLWGSIDPTATTTLIRKSYVSVTSTRYAATSTTNLDSIDTRTKEAAISSSTTTTTQVGEDLLVLTEYQKDFIKGYLNKHQQNLLKSIVEIFSEVGTILSNANAFTGGSMIISSATIVNIYNTSLLEIQTNVSNQYNNKNPYTIYKHNISFNSYPIIERQKLYDCSIRPPLSIPKLNDNNALLLKNNGIILPIDQIIRSLCRMVWITKQSPCITGQLIQLGIQLNGSGIGQLPKNLFLNQVPHNVYVRQWFYDSLSVATNDAVVLCSQGIVNNRMRINIKIPELNPDMDSYRIGTLLELVRHVTINLVNTLKVRVKICVQGSMGAGIFTGIPKQLSGVSKIIQLMDWQNNTNEANDGILGTYVRFGEISKQHVFNEIRTNITTTNNDGSTTTSTEIQQYQDDVFILICPQSMIGVDSSIIPLLEEMTIAIGPNRPIILINADLTDKVSSGGQQSIRGRQERINFDQSFNTIIYYFQNIYVTGTSYFPILGCISKLHPLYEPYIAYQRRDIIHTTSDNNTEKEEMYIPIVADETIPSGSIILQSFER